MIALLQRVTQAQVTVNGNSIATIDDGLLVLIGVEKNDTELQADRLLTRVLGYRLFADDQDKMNLSVQDVSGGLLLVPQFTLAADTSTGKRPSFSSAALPADGKHLFDYMARQAKMLHSPVATGQFGADMQVALVNNGPVTFWLQV